MTNCIGKIIKSLPIFHVPFLNASYWQNIIPWEMHLQKQQLRHRNNIFPVSLLLTSKKHLPNKAFNKMYLIVVTVYVTQREINSILRTKNRDTRILCYVFLGSLSILFYWDKVGNIRKSLYFAQREYGTGNVYCLSFSSSFGKLNLKKW